MQFNKIFNYKKHIRTIFHPLIDLKIKNLKKSTKVTKGLIVSLTTYSKRINNIKYTLYSLFNQTITPEKIILNVSPEITLPKNLSKFIELGLEIHRCNDIGSYTKLIPTLKRFPDKTIVTADDDIYYPPSWLEILYNAHLEEPSLIHCHRAHRISFINKSILPYEKWEKHISKVKPSFSNFLTGVGGVLYPPNSFTDEVYNQNVFSKITPYADDIWFWGMAVLANRKINVVKNNISYLTSTNIFTQLGHNNLYTTNKLGGNDRQLEALLNEYPIIEQKLKSSLPIKLVFDASSLYVQKLKNAKRAGIYNVASNLLTKFLEDENFEITLYCDYKFYYFIKELAQELGINLIKETSKLKRTCGFLFYNAQGLPHKLKFSILYTLRLLDIILPINKKLKNELNKTDIYFSPFEGIIKEAQYLQIKKYQFIHDIIPLLENKKLPPFHWARQVFANIETDTIYFTNSEYTKDDFLRFYSTVPIENVETAYLGYTVKPQSENNIYERYGIPLDKQYILSLCSIGKRKNLNFAIKNFEKFIEQYNIKDLVLVLAGGCWNSYKKEIENAACNKNIIFTGYINDEDIPNLFTNAKIFIYPSLYEGFGLPVIEAMSYGTPVITSNRTSLPEVAGGAAWLINPESDTDMLNALKELYFNEDTYNTYKEKGYMRASEFTWDNCYNIIKAKILEDLAK